MEIGINLKEDEYEVAEIDDIIIGYPAGIEIGYLKINPERIPVIVSEKIAAEAIARNKDHYIQIDVNGGKYVVITDNRSVIYGEGFIDICGTAYIAKKQVGTYTALTSDEIDDWIYDFEDDEMFSELYPEDYPQAQGIRIEL